MPKVAMKELIPTNTTKNALAAPITKPTASAAMNAEGKALDAGHDHAGYGQSAGHAEVKLAHQNNDGQPECHSADEGDPAQGHRIGGEYDRLE